MFNPLGVPFYHEIVYVRIICIWNRQLFLKEAHLNLSFRTVKSLYPNFQKPPPALKNSLLRAW